MFYRCTVCHKLYTDRSGLNIHMKKHTTTLSAQKITSEKETTLEKKSYECDICQKVYLVKRSLLVHLHVVHVNKNIKNHKCDECGNRLCR